MQYQHAGHYSTQYQSGSQRNTNGSGGVGFFGLLQIALIVLKLLGAIDWPWWLVWSPTWGGLLIWIVVLVCAVLFGMWLNGDFTKKKEK